MRPPQFLFSFYVLASLCRRLPSRSYPDRLATGGELRGGMLHMMSGGGGKSITFTFLGGGGLVKHYLQRHVEHVRKDSLKSS